MKPALVLAVLLVAGVAALGAAPPAHAGPTACVHHLDGTCPGVACVIAPRRMVCVPWCDTVACAVLP